jgi:RimJ/RimL family protein N-acetyltransferase
MAETPSAARLQTPRLVLHPLRVADAAEMVGVLADPGLYRFTGGAPPTLAELRARYAIQVRGRSVDGVQRWCNWVVRLRQRGDAIGVLQATIGLDTAELAWVIGAGDQGSGYAREAAAAVARWLNDNGAPTLVAHIHPDHTASIGVARSLALSPTAIVVNGEQRWERRADHTGCMPPSSTRT